MNDFRLLTILVHSEHVFSANCFAKIIIEYDYLGFFVSREGVLCESGGCIGQLNTRRRRWKVKKWRL